MLFELFAVPAPPEVCAADSDYPEAPVDLYDLLLSAIGAVLAVVAFTQGRNTDSVSLDKLYRVCCDHFRFLLIARVAFDRRLSALLRVAFDLVFPAYNLSLWAYRYTIYPLLLHIGLPGGCTAIVSWGVLLFIVATGSVFLGMSRERRATQVTLFNLMIAPDAQLAVSSAFAGWGRTVSYAKGTCCFATSLQWTFFCLVVPSVMAASNEFAPCSELFEADFRRGLHLWLFAVKGMQVGLIYALHLTKLLLAQLPGFMLCALLLLVGLYRQLQTTYWPYKSRFLNFVADDSYLGLMLMCLWGRYRHEYLEVAAFCLPLRQMWRVVALLFSPESRLQVLRGLWKRTERSSPPPEAESSTRPQKSKRGRRRARS